MNIAIVGNGGDKFTSKQEEVVKELLRSLFLRHKGCTLITGGSPRGGVDIWAVEIADTVPELVQEIKVYRPEVWQWDPPSAYGFKQRNIDIAKDCYELYNILSNEYPEGYKGTREKCYHCEKTGRRFPVHVKSGACWTMWLTNSLGKTVSYIIIGKDRVANIETIEGSG